MEITTFKKLKFSANKGWTENFRGLITLALLLCVIVEICIVGIYYLMKAIVAIIVMILDEIASAIKKNHEKNVAERQARIEYNNSHPDSEEEYSGDRTVYVQHLKDPNNYSRPAPQRSSGGGFDMSIPSTRAPGTSLGRNSNPVGKIPRYKGKNPVGKW